MGVEPPTEEQDDGALAAMQATLESEQIAFVDTLDGEIKTVIEQASTLQRYDYVIGTVDNVWTSPKNHRHFELVQYNAETDTVDQIHCVIFNSRRSAITTALTEGRQVAVAGQLSFFPPEGNGSILVKEVESLDTGGSRQASIVPSNRQQQVLLAVVIVIVLVIIGTFFLLCAERRENALGRLVCMKNSTIDSATDWEKCPTAGRERGSRSPPRGPR